MTNLIIHKQTTEQDLDYFVQTGSLTEKENDLIPTSCRNNGGFNG